MKEWFIALASCLAGLCGDQFCNNNRYINDQFSCYERIENVNHDYEVNGLLKNIINSLVDLKVFDLKNSSYIQKFIGDNHKVLKNNLRCCCFKSCRCCDYFYFNCCCSYCLSCTYSCDCTCGDDYSPLKCCCFSFKNQGSNEKSMRELKFKMINLLADEIEKYKCEDNSKKLEIIKEKAKEINRLINPFPISYSNHDNRILEKKTADLLNDFMKYISSSVIVDRTSQGLLIELKKNIDNFCNYYYVNIRHENNLMVENNNLDNSNNNIINNQIDNNNIMNLNNNQGS